MHYLMAKVLPVSFQQHCSIKNHHLMPILQIRLLLFFAFAKKITSQRLTAFSFAILAISGQTIAFNLARAAGSAKTIGPNALLKIQVRYSILSSHHDFLSRELKPVNGAIFSHNCMSPLLHNCLVSDFARCICYMS